MQIYRPTFEKIRDMMSLYNATLLFLIKDNKRRNEQKKNG